MLWGGALCSLALGFLLQTSYPSILPGEGSVPGWDLGVAARGSASDLPLHVSPESGSLSLLFSSPALP